MTKVLQRPTLVLNRNWQPINVATVARALIMLWNESARVVDPTDYQLYDWDDWSKQAKMRLRKVPTRPTWKPLYSEHASRMESWSKFISEAYWNAELES